MNMDDIKVEPLVRKREGMQPVTVCNDIRVTHLPTGLVVEVPHEFTRSQNQSLKTAIAMLEAVVPNASETPFHKLANEWLNTIDLNNHDIPDRMKIQREVYKQCAKDLKALMARMQKVSLKDTVLEDDGH